MKKFKLIFSPRCLIVWLIILFLIFTVPELSKPSMSQTEAIVTNMAVELIDDEINVYVTTLTPASQNKLGYQIYSSSGKTLGDAVERLGMIIGKNMGFSQCEMIAFGDNVASTGLMGVLDFMVRTKKISRNALLINFSGELENFVKGVERLYTEKQLKIQEMLNFDRSYVEANNSNIEEFYKNYYSTTSIDVLPVIKVSVEKDENAVEVASTGEDPKSQDGQQMTEPKIYIINDGSSSAFKNGVKVLDIDSDMTKKLYMLQAKNYAGVITIDNVNNELYENASVMFNITKGKVKTKPIFYEGKPKVKVQCTFEVFIEEVNQPFPTDKFLMRNKEFIDDYVLDKLSEKIKREINEAIEFCKQNKLDLISLFDKFDSLKNGETTKYVKQVGIENFLDELTIDVSVKIDSTY